MVEQWNRIGLEIIGPPFTGHTREWFERTGPRRDHLAFEVLDAGTWHLKMIRVGAERLYQPTEKGGVLEIDYRLQNGLIVQLIQFSDAQAAPPLAASDAGSPGVCNMHHFSLSFPNLDPMVKFFKREMQMKIVLDWREDSTVFLADEFSIAACGRDAACIELMEPSGWDHIDNFLEKYGPGIDHICFIVPDVDAAHAEISAKGIEFTDPPVDFAGSRVAFFNDPDTQPIEIESPVVRKLFLT